MKAIEVVGKALGILIGLGYLWLIQENETLLWGWFLLVMASLGIPHGAIDHLLYHKKAGGKSGLQKFIFFYLGIMLIYLVCWVYLPITSLILFLIMSAYHFGQANFIPIKVENNKYILYLCTGFYFLAVILFGDFDRTSEILQPMVDIQVIRPYSAVSIISLFFLSSFFIARLTSQKKFFYIIEMVVLGICLYHMPLLLAFITYFGFWHAFPSLIEEYSSLSFDGNKNKFLLFVKQLLPFSLISMFGISFILIFLNDWLPERELTLLFFVMVSLISAPHIWVMNMFLEDPSKQHLPLSK
ncbi:Brp/Blh family beta-carotene 15,15'-dioxygenase [Lunatibacter salilacus]|uniref:Brp/Blh family beta-carotene 15,15'-dioxygenase n=1 Tax=Lunatibacter salilacus TaxID=2483804 RepID=UPI00131C79B8|nr:Brp/Blh family beta-carotene 15,15'-dioxygenase [Lunatibacter salilacus]